MDKTLKKPRISRTVFYISIALTVIISACEIIALVKLSLQRHYSSRDETDRTMALEALHCDNKRQRPQLVQYGDYWVYRNFVTGAQVPCNMWHTLVMQGTYEDIYKLSTVFKGEPIGMLVSFAVYVPDQLHFNQTLKAIAYVRECTPPAPNGQKWCQLLTSYHLYFRQGHVSWSLNRDPDELEVECDSALAESAESGESNEQQTDDDSIERQHNENEQSDEQGVKQSTKDETTQPESTQTAQAHARIVGQNIAQLAAITKLTLNANVNTYQSFGFFKMWAFDMFGCAAAIGGMTPKTVFRVPAFLVHDLDADDNNARGSKGDLHTVVTRKGIRAAGAGDECYPVPRETWMQFDGKYMCSGRYSVSKYYGHLLTHHLYLFGDGERIPLLPEHSGLSLVESENLRLYNMALQKFDFFISFKLYLLVNATAEDFLQRNQLHAIDVFSMALQNFRLTYTKKLYLIHNITTVDFMPRNQFIRIDRAIENQFEIMYDDKNVRKLVH